MYNMCAFFPKIKYPAMSAGVSRLIIWFNQWLYCPRGWHNSFRCFTQTKTRQSLKVLGTWKMRCSEMKKTAVSQSHYKLKLHDVIFRFYYEQNVPENN